MDAMMLAWFKQMKGASITSPAIRVGRNSYDSGFVVAVTGRFGSKTLSVSKELLDFLVLTTKMPASRSLLQALVQSAVDDIVKGAV